MPQIERQFMRVLLTLCPMFLQKRFSAHTAMLNCSLPTLPPTQSVSNLRKNPNTCISFVKVLVQKGFKLKSADGKSKSSV